MTKEKRKHKDQTRAVVVKFNSEDTPAPFLDEGVLERRRRARRAMLMEKARGKDGEG